MATRTIAREEYYHWPNPGWWERTRELAAGMTDDELAYARRDAYEASQALPGAEGKYLDQCSVYRQEQEKRRILKKS
jgi:hypothetical protein